METRRKRIKTGHTEDLAESSSSTRHAGVPAEIFTPRRNLGTSNLSQERDIETSTFSISVVDTRAQRADFINDGNAASGPASTSNSNPNNAISQTELSEISQRSRLMDSEMADASNERRTLDSEGNPRQDIVENVSIEPPETTADVIYIGDSAPVQNAQAQTREATSSASVEFIQTGEANSSHTNNSSLASAEATVENNEPNVVNNEPIVVNTISNTSSSAGKSPEAARAPRKDDSDELGDSMSCPICMEPWTGDGPHRICCLACGHLFGRSCIRRWLKESGKKNSKCPHCNLKAKVEDIRNLYVPNLMVADSGNQELLEEVTQLKTKNQDLLRQNEKLNKELQQLQMLLKRNAQNSNESFRKDFFPSSPRLLSTNSNKGTPQRSQTSGASVLGKRPQTIEAALSRYQRAHIWEIDKGVPAGEGRFELQEEFSLPGATVFDMDAFSQILLVAQKSTSVGANFCLNKISLVSLSDRMVIPLPEGTGAIRDIRVAPVGGKFPGRLALVASLGKKISLFSLESNHVVLRYNVESPCWSCAWDPNEPNHVFAGLQDGSLTIFDLRQTSAPLRSIHGNSRQPVHTLYAVNPSNMGSGILSASSSGVCFWDTSSGLENCRPFSVPYSDNGGVCVALAYNNIAELGVSTFRPKPCAQSPESGSSSNAIMSSQMGTQSSTDSHPFRATHVPLCRTLGGSSSSVGAAEKGWTYGNPMFSQVSPVGMRKSALVSRAYREGPSSTQSVFAFGDDETHSLMIWDVRTLSVIDRLRPHNSPILDIRSMSVGDHTILGCTSVSTLQVYKG